MIALYENTYDTSINEVIINLEVTSLILARCSVHQDKIGTEYGYYLNSLSIWMDRFANELKSRDLYYGDL